MNNQLIAQEFDKLVKNKFDVYNSLFLNLPFPNISNVGMLIPLLNKVCQQQLDKGSDPLETMDSFFKVHTDLKTEKDEIDFMFQVIQYVERQIVLYDSAEDAAFSELQEIEKNLSLKDYLNVVDHQNDKAEILKKLSNFSTRIVFTAHPTQFYPPSVLDIIAKLKTLITKNDINEIDVTLRQLGMTSLLNSKKPTPLDEAKNIIYFLRNVHYNAAAALYNNIKKSFPIGSFENHEILQFGFWPGGDRDGNPFVTAPITNDVANELRVNLMKCYYQDIKALGKKLTFRKVEDTIKSLRDKLYTTMFNLEKTMQFDEIINPLYEVKATLIEHYSSLFVEDIDIMIDKVKIFRTHFAVLDIRQNHSVHEQTVEEILREKNIIKDSLSELNKDELISILLNKDFQVDSNKFGEGIVKDTIITIEQLKEIQRKNGEAGCNRYIISNSEDIYSVLYVYALLKWCCWHEEAITMDIVPLFESMEGMTNSRQIMTELYDMPVYRQHVSQRKDVQPVMLGFSDGTKDGGYLRANWSILETKENLSEVCDQYGINVIFFDGRGGPPARGGGKTHRFYASQTNKIANHAIQLTIQGQTITSKYGNKEHYTYNSEQLITAGLAQHLSKEKNVISSDSRQLIELLADLSFDKYTKLKNHEKFIPYLEQKSTLKYYSAANIGSRPSKRGNNKQLTLDDLRAISFVGSWSQLKQNVPGYFGLGTAIQSLVKEGRLDELKQLFNEVPFFKALILNSMMSLSKCYFELTSYIAKDKEFKDFWNILHDEYLLSKEMTLLISDYDILMQEEPVSRNSIQIREQIVLPLLVIQQYALQKIEQNSPNKEAYAKIVKRSLYGNINASRNSA